MAPKSFFNGKIFNDKFHIIEEGVICSNMGFFDMSKPKGTGFAQIPNTQNFTNEDLYEKLSKIKVSCGTPVSGLVGDYDAILYKQVSVRFDVFVRVDGKNVICGKIGTDGVSSANTAVNYGLDAFLGHKDEAASQADHAVDEIAEILSSLEKGEEVTESKVSLSIKTESGEVLEFYMKQKAISLKPKFDMFDENEQVVYHVEGDMTRLNFSIQENGTEVAKLKKKPIPVAPEYVIYEGGKEIGKIKKKIKLTNPELTGTLNGKDVHIVGSLMGTDFDIQAGSVTIGQVDTTSQAWSDVYRVKVFDESYKAVMAAITIICDNVVDASRE